MNALIQKIKDILENKFTMSNYVALIQEVFSSATLISPEHPEEEHSHFSSHIKSASHVANYLTPDDKKIIIFAVELVKESYVETSRSTQRNYARQLIDNSNSDAALIAFYTEGEPKWRLSFVRLDYEMKIENGRLKTAENLTPARRYSYLVGKGEPPHTAVDRMRMFITDKNSHPTLNDLVEIFSVERVTKEFFDLYCEKYHQLREHLLENEDFLAESDKCGFSVEQFAKKLLGQIVFLYFLQKKGWLGVGVWPASLTEKEYNNVFFTKGARGKIIKEYLPVVYEKRGEIYYFKGVSALHAIPDEAEELIANNLPKSKTKDWGKGSQKFLRTLYGYAQKRGGNFYDDYLEPLFYDTLNRNRGNLGYSSQLHCRIPFLSGGLFEPIKGYDWKISRFNIPNELFSNQKDEYDYNADGILDIFDRYNFTISEDEPMEREVAIDPEMLGKVFENLLEVTDRKSKGAFYTPREIVHYMCQESLITYLVNSTELPERDIRDFILYGDFMKDEDTVKARRLGRDAMFISENIFKIDTHGKIVVNRLKELDDALANICVADPAVGSGAFPLGMLNEIVRARQTLTEYMAIAERSKAVSDAQAGYYVRNLRRNRTVYDLKKYTIKNSIFAVDIEPSAVDITQLRLWLSLVIDDEINPEATNELEGHRNPLPLPNLDCNILCGNSLVDEFEGVSLLNQSDLIGTSQHYGQYDMGQRNFEAVMPKLLETQDKIFYCDDPLKKEQLNEELQALKDMAIEAQLYMMDEDKRKRYEQSKDLSSKPYVLWQLDFARVFREKGGFDVVIGNPPYIQLQKQVNEETGAKLGDLYAKSGYETYTKTGDLYCLFYEKGYLLLHQKGTLCFITSNKWMRAGYGIKLRNFFACKTNPLLLIDFAGQKIFESATVDTNILMFEKGKNKESTKTCIARENCSENLSVFIEQNGSRCSFSSSESWVILSPIERSIKEKIEAIGIPLKNWDVNIYRGILTGFNEAFIISGEKKDELIAKDPRSAEIIRPILRGRDIKRYDCMYADLWLINMHNGLKSSNQKPLNVNDYPAIKEHLDTFYDRLAKRSDKGVTPYNLRNCVYMNDFSQQKIIWGNLCLSSQFALAEEGTYINAPSSMIVPGNKYLLAILNSKLGDWYIRQLGVTRNGGYFEYKPMFVEKLPIPQINSEAQNVFTELVDKIIDCKKNQIESLLFEEKIDHLVFGLYGLNQSEIEYILG